MQFVKPFLLYILVCLSANVFGQWNDHNTGINDHLTGVVFYGNNGVVAGHSGIYYTTTGGVGPASWTEFLITGNSADSLILSNTQFQHCFSNDSHTDYAFAVGRDTIANRAIVFQFHIPTQSYMFLYQGTIGSSLVNMDYSDESNQYFAVGPDGLIVRFNLLTPGIIEPSGQTVDFESISFYNEYFNIGADGYRIYGTDDSPGMTLNVQVEIATHFKDVARVGTNFAYSTGDDFYFLHMGTGSTGTNGQFNFGPLNAEALIYHGSYFFIATDHGIFTQGYSNPVEWQPSSLTLHYEDFWSPPSSTTLYACGENGTLMSTTNNGDEPLPYVSVTEDGGCVGQFLSMSAEYGSSSSCEWYLDGSLVSTSCSNYQQWFNTSGFYEIKLIGTNSTGSDSSIVNFYVVDTPQINLPTVLDDVLLCKEETIDIEIDNSELNVYYELVHAISGDEFGASPAGNSSTISYTTDLVTDAGDYFMVATSTLADCSSEFTDTIFIDVEETKAAYHVGISNAVPGETVYFYENCIDADNYEWNFSPSASILQSNLADPTNDFSSAGNQATELICWSNDLCYDTIQGPGPMIFIPPSVYDSCWINQNSGDDPNWVGYHYPDITDITEHEDGYLMSGTFYDHAFASKYGDSLEFDWFGSYMAFYDKNGVYKWNIHSVGVGNGFLGTGNNYTRFDIRSTAIDHDGNILACGYFEDYFVDNAGDTINVPIGFGQIIKFDSKGRTIWQRSSDRMYPAHIAVDNSNNVLVTGARTHQWGNDIYHYLNGVAVDTFPLISDVNTGLTKLDPDGNLLWDIPIENDNTNGFIILRPTVDDSNNVYLCGDSEYGCTLYSTDQPVSGNLIDAAMTFGWRNIFLTKLDSLGNHLWHIEAYNGGSCYAYNMSTDGDGNCYISGRNNAYAPQFGLEQIWVSTDGSTDTTDAGQYFVSKVNSDGINQWITGAYSSYYGFGWEMDLKNDTLYVLGTVSENGPLYDTVQFYNPDSSFVNLGIFTDDYFVAAYDTSGILHYVSRNGDNSANITHHSWQGFFRGSDHKFYAARTAQAWMVYDYVDFGDTLDPTNGRDSWVTKFCAECGILQTPSFQSSIDTTICIGSNYTFPGGNTVNNITVNMSDTLLMSSINAIDSLVITNVWVNGYTEIDSVDICEFEPYTFPDGTTIDSVSTSLTHVSSFQTTFGCDSLITTELTMIPAYHLIDTVSHCPSQGYIFPDFTIIGGITGVYSHTSTFLFGQCDSSITTVLVPYPGFLTTDSVTVCNGDDHTFPDGTTQTNITVPTTYQSVFNVGGCDSTITTVISIAGLAPFTDSDTICAGEDYTFHDGTTVTNITSVTAYSSSFTDINGCDSTIQTTIYPTTTTFSITQQDTLLTADQAPGSGITYQWIDCDNGNAQIPGENGQSYIATVNGSYAVIIDNNGCIDTSSCVIVSGIGWKNNQVNGFEIFPNPTTDYINIELDSKFDFSHFILTNTLGQIIGSYSIDDAIMKIELPLADGVYFIHVFSTEGLQGTVKVIKN